MTFGKILFPVDYSEPCKAIVPYIQDMMRHYSAELTVVHAYGPEARGFIDLPMLDPSFLEKARAFEEERLAQFSRESFPGQRVESIIELNEPATAIHKVIQNRGVDLVMLPTHGRGPLRRLLLGSVTSKVLHDVNASVRTGTGSGLASHKPGLPYRAVVCALNGSAEDIAILRAAHTFAASYQAQLSLVRVVEMPHSTMDIDYTQFVPAIMDTADRQARASRSIRPTNGSHRNNQFLRYQPRGLYWRKHGAPQFPYLVCSNSPVGDRAFSIGSPWKQRFLPHRPDDDDRRYSHRVGVHQSPSADLFRCQDRNRGDRALGGGGAADTLHDEKHESRLDPHYTQAGRSNRTGLQSIASCGRESVSGKGAEDQRQGLADRAGRR